MALQAPRRFPAPAPPQYRCNGRNRQQSEEQNRRDQTACKLDEGGTARVEVLQILASSEGARKLCQFDRGIGFQKRRDQGEPIILRERCRNNLLCELARSRACSLRAFYPRHPGTYRSGNDHPGTSLCRKCLRPAGHEQRPDTNENRNVQMLRPPLCFLDQTTIENRLRDPELRAGNDLALQAIDL